MSVLNILNMLHNLRFFFSSKCRLSHNATLFGSCIIHILNTGVLKIEKKNSSAKWLTTVFVNSFIQIRLSGEQLWTGVSVAHCVWMWACECLCVCVCVRLAGRRDNCVVRQPVQTGTLRRRDVGGGFLGSFAKRAISPCRYARGTAHGQLLYNCHK
jgi:hypothetical protein